MYTLTSGGDGGGDGSGVGVGDGGGDYAEIRRAVITIM